jgi:hypothetical protein
LRVALYTVPLKVADAPIVLWASLVRTVLAIPHIVALANTNTGIADSITIAFKLPYSGNRAPLLFARPSIVWRLAYTIAEVTRSWIVCCVRNSIVTMKCTVERIVLELTISVVADSIRVIGSGQ